MTRPVQRVAEQHEPRRPGLGCDHARDAAAKRMPADDGRGQVRPDLIAKRLQRPLGRSPRQSQGVGVDAELTQPVDVRLHRLGAPRGAMREPDLRGGHAPPRS